MGVVMAMYVELFGRDRYYGGMLRESREDEFISNVFGPLRNFEETSWLEELVEKSFDDPAFSNDMANGYDLEFWTRYSAPPGRETQENDTELSCVLEAKDHTLMVVARYWHELSAQTAEDVERDQIVRALDCGLAALGPRARLLVITGNPEPPKLVSQYWEEPDLLRDRLTDPPADLSAEELAGRIGWTNWEIFRETLASRIGDTPINQTQWNFAKDLVAYLDLVSSRGRGLRVRAGGYLHFWAPGTSGAKNLPFGAPKIIFQTLDVIFTEVAPCLNFNNNQGPGAVVG